MRNTIGACAVVLASGAAAIAGGNLVVNGSFETGDFTGWTLNDVNATTSVTAGGFAGGQAAFFGSFDSEWDSLGQQVSTAPGAEYTLRFLVLNLGVGDDGLAVSLNGAEVYRSEPFFYQIEQWHTVEIGFLAQSMLTSFEISAGDNLSAIGLDVVELYRIPAPGAAALLGLAGLAASRRRR